MKKLLKALPLILCLPLVADEKPETKAPNEKKEEPKKKETHKVTRGTFKVEFELDGIFMNPNAREVSIETKTWGLLNVLDAVAQGKVVRKGQSLVTLDFEKIDEKIRDLKFEQELTSLDLQVAEAELKLMETTSPIELQNLERKNKQVQEDLKRYREIKKPRQEEAAEVSLKNARYSLDYAEEELKQLRKMYEADDLTEETEEIILKRAEASVERARFSLEGAEIKKAETIRISIPRESIEIEESARQSERTLKTSRKTHPVGLLKKSIAVKKLRLQLENVKENLERLKADHSRMRVPAPVSGTLFRGTIEKGKWSGSAGVDPRLRKGGVLKPNEIFMTILPDGPLSIHTTVPEKHLRHLKKGLKVRVHPAIDPNLQMEAVVSEVSAAPVVPGRHGVTIDIQLDKDSPIRAGMTAKLKLVPYIKENALWVPKGALIQGKEPGIQFVHVLRNDKKPRKLKVETGRRSGDRVEILKGLRVGTEILLGKPGK